MEQFVKEEINTINFDSFNKEVFTGYENGKLYREQSSLEALDNAPGKIKIIISDKIYSVSSSFIRGMLGESMLKCNSRDKFYEKFVFETRYPIKNVVDGIVTRTFVLKDKLGFY